MVIKAKEILELLADSLGPQQVEQTDSPSRDDDEHHSLKQLTVLLGDG